MWTTLLRNISGSTPEHGYFPTTTAVGNVYTPRDMYYGTLLSAAEALFSGITTVHDWCHNIITPQHAEEDLRALQETGIRGACRPPRPSILTTSRALPASGRAFPMKACSRWGSAGAAYRRRSGCPT